MTEDSVTFDDQQKFVIGLWLRIVAAGVFLVLLTPLTATGADFPWSECYPAYLGLIGLIIANPIYWWFGRRRGFPLSDFYVHWTVDLFLITITLYGLGGALLPSSITAYMLIVITSAVFISKSASLAVATGSAFAYGGSVTAELAGWLDPEYDLAMPALSPGMAMLVIGGPVFMVYLVAYISGTLGDQLNTAIRLLRVRNGELKERNEALDRIRGELDFQSNVLAHDVRSPVSAAYAALEAFRRHVPGDTPNDLIDIALRNLNRVEDMIDALHQAREGLESGERHEEVDFIQLIEELRIELDQRLSSQGVSFSVIGRLPVVEAIRSRVVVMLRNLLTNAIRYVPDDGTGAIAVGMEEHGEQWDVFVRDNGCGIKAEFQSIIFEMFRKAPQKQKSPGMGVGLALVRKVADQHGWSVWVESDGSSGSTFWIRIPKRRKDGLAPPQVEL
jgi:signal transduction histidine kinase